MSLIFSAGNLEKNNLLQQRIFRKPFHTGTYFFKFGAMKLFRASIVIVFLGFFCSFAAAQEYEAEVDSAWIASQNGGSTEMNDGNDEQAPSCIGDGCGEAVSEAPVTDANAEPSTEPEPQQPKAVAQNDDEEEDCTPADSLLPECKDNTTTSVDDDEDDDTYDRYINENSDISRASREGFTKAIELGFRLGAGINKSFGHNAEDWNLGIEVTGGLIAQMNIGNGGLSSVVELDFSYRRYNYEAEFVYDDYSESDEATISIALFEIPVILRYAINEGNFFVGLGFDLGLKLTDVSTFKQTIDTKKGIEEEDPHDNTLPAALLELGGIVDLGYFIARNVAVDVRFLQNFTNLLNEDVIAETSMLKTTLYGLHVTVGVSFLL